MADNKTVSRENNARTSRRRPGRMKGFFKGVWSELKKVHWPTKKQLATYTGVVIFAVLIMAIAISVFDLAISSLFEWMLGLS